MAFDLLSQLPTGSHGVILGIAVVLAFAWFFVRKTKPHEIIAHFMQLFTLITKSARSFLRSIERWVLGLLHTAPKQSNDPLLLTVGDKSGGESNPSVCVRVETDLAVDVAVTDDFEEDVARLVEGLSAFEGSSLLDQAAQWIYSQISNLIFVSVHSADWLAREYRCLALYPGSETLTTFGRNIDPYPIGPRQGIIASTFLGATQCHGPGVVVDDTISDTNVLSMDHRTRSELTHPILWRDRPILVLNLESADTARFREDANLKKVLERVTSAIQKLVPSLRDTLFRSEMSICDHMRRDYSAHECTPDGICDILDDIAGHVRDITELEPEFVTCSICEPGRREATAFQLYGMWLTRSYRQFRREFRAGMEHYRFDVTCPTEPLMTRAEDAQRGARPRLLVRVTPVVASSSTCVPSNFPHKYYAFVPIVDYDGAWLAGVYLHFLRGNVDHMGESFYSYQLELFADALMPILRCHRERWYATFRQHGPLPRSRPVRVALDYCI